MQQLVFICQTNAVRLFLYNCAVAIAKEFVGVKISFYVNENENTKYKNFNKFINFVDARFSNFKQNPNEIIDLKTIAKQNFEIIYDFNKIENCDWIVLENKNLSTNLLHNLTKNGIISLDCNLQLIKSQLFNNQKITVNLLIKEKNNENWSIYSKKLGLEKGLKNNQTKVLFSQSVFLVQFLKNFKTVNNLSEILELKKNQYNDTRIYTYYLKLTSKLLFRKLRTKKLNWKIALKQNNQLTFVKQPENSFWADPFLVNKNRTNYVFFEELKPDGIGAISCMQLSENFEIIDKKMIIDKAYHLSFPNVFEQDNNYFMIPESSANNSLDLYRCNNFPFDWRFEKILIDKIRLIDPILLFHDNLYWIFANKIEDFEFDNNERLYLYFTNDLSGDNWQSHPENPIIHDASLARNAGKVYQKNNQLFRISQNCSTRYGNNLVVNQITTLTTANYSEQKIEEIFPEKKFKGMHTMNFVDDLQVFDFLEID